jgi:hypothetical protein
VVTVVSPILGGGTMPRLSKDSAPNVQDAGPSQPCSARTFAAPGLVARTP